ncbi:MAG: DoxX family protein [Saprospirales bacterium]|nr:DoxX family protein [Saprospirales bacterium]
MFENGHLTQWFTRNKLLLVRWSLAVSYLWFGMLKFFPGMSPAEELAQATIRALSFGLIPDELSIVLLAIWEVGLGLALVSGWLLRFASACRYRAPDPDLYALFFSRTSFHKYLGFTIVGQYIVKPGLPGGLRHFY